MTGNQRFPQLIFMYLSKLISNILVNRQRKTFTLIHIRVKLCASVVKITPYLSLILFIFISSNFNCNKSPIEVADKQNEMSLTYFLATNITDGKAEIHWGCTSEAVGYLLFGEIRYEKVFVFTLKSKQHYHTLTNLKPGKQYIYMAFCENMNFVSTSYLQSFSTLTPPTPPPPEEPIGTELIREDVKQRGIWILGGISSDGSALTQVDLYDPVEDYWYSYVTDIPTARSYAGIVSFNQKIYVMGGLVSGSVVKTVEEFDTSSQTWRTLEDMPVGLQGMLAGAGNDAIYIIGGSITSSAANSTPNVVYKFIPNDGGDGTWYTITAGSAIPERIDLSGCSTGGNIYFNGGRYTDGSAQLDSDAYIPSGNSTTSITEANLSVSTFGAAAACYRPDSDGPYSTDSPTMFIIGGSTLTDTSQPPSAINPTNRFDYYLTPPNTNTMNTGNVLPVSLYYPAVEISHDNRELYVFGGAETVNTPSSKVYSISIVTPSIATWVTETNEMPIARFGHKAVIITQI